MQKETPKTFEVEKNHYVVCHLYDDNKTVEDVDAIIKAKDDEISKLENISTAGI